MSNDRLVAGLALGLAVALFGPIGLSVASHSGNHPDGAGQAAFSRRGALAVWAKTTETPKKRVVSHYKVHVWQQAYAFGGGSSVASANAQGEAVAETRTCTYLKSSGSSSCTTTTWRAPMPVAPAGAGVPGFVMDPALVRAELRADLNGPAGTCSVDAVWSSHSPAYPVSPPWPTELRADGTVSLTTSCFTLPSQAGPLSQYLWSAVSR